MKRDAGASVAAPEIALAVLFFTLALASLRSGAAYLGGDTTREAWRAAELLRSGRLTHVFGGPYDSDLFSLVFVPFVAVLGRTIRCLQAATFCLESATVAVLYVFLRRTFGRTAAFALGAQLAASPLLHAQFTAGPAASAPLMVGAVMLLASLGQAWAPYAAAAAGGFFVSTHAYFILPLGVFVAAFSRAPLGAARARKLLACFGAGLLPLIWKLAGPAGSGAGDWLKTLLGENAARWEHPLEAAAALWRQWADGLASPWLVVAWSAAFVYAVFSRRESRRCAAALAAGLAAAALVQSTHGGLGARHVLSFLPFQWLFLGPGLSDRGARRPRAVLASIVLAIAVAQAAIVRRAAGKARAFGERVRADSARAAELVSRPDVERCEIAADNDNAYFSLLFLAPAARISYSRRTTPVERAGRIACALRSGNGGGLPGPLVLSGRTIYETAWIR